MGNEESKSAPRNTSSTAQTQNKTESKQEPSKPSKERTKTRTFVESKVDTATREAFDEWMNERLTKYFHDIQEQILKLKIGQSERNEIGTAVEEFLDFLFKETERVDRRFRVDGFRDVHKVGTYHENMEIICVDQLEYCVIMDDISKENIKSVEKVSTKDDECVKVEMTENCAIQWEDCVEKDLDDKYWLRSDVKGLVAIFFDRVAQAIDEVRAKNRDSVYRKHGRLDLLTEHGVVKQRAYVELKFTWNKENSLTVKLTPCVSYGDVKKFFVEDSMLNYSALKTAKSAGKVILQPVSDADYYFKLHTGHLELDYMKDHVTRTHRDVYQMMKFLVQGYNLNTVQEADFFSEQVLKMLLITHCNNCKKNEKFGDCVLALIDDMQKLLKTYRDKIEDPPVLKNCFYVYQNVLLAPCRKRGENAINLNLAGLEQIANHLIKEIGCTALYDFEKSIKNLVPLNAFILRKDYIARKYGKAHASEEAELEARKALVDAVSNQRFTVQF